MQNVYVVPRPECRVLFNGTLVFAVNMILCTGKWIKLFSETVLVFNLHFQYKHGLSLQENQMHHSKEHTILVQK
jgi:hypothetical protein